jgi:YesN/AraC family two-component response regulator
MAYHLLLVDDDREFREEFKECFGEYNIVEAGSGEEALALLRKPHEIDLVLLDVKLPGKDGTEILKEIKQIAPDLGIIMLTAYSTKDIAIEALKGHADDYLEKPLRLDRTRELIEQHLAKHDGRDGISGEGIQGKIEHVKQFVARNSEKKVGLEEAARSVFLSPKYLSRAFKEQTGKGFNEYCLELKVQRAKEVLKETGLTVGQISDRLGYQNEESFIRTFKKLTGLRPTEYRKGKANESSQPKRPAGKVKGKDGARKKRIGTR